MNNLKNINKSILLNKKRVVRNQIRNYLKNNGYNLNNKKQNDIFLLFCNEINQYPAKGESYYTFLIKLYEDNEFDLLRVHSTRPDINNSLWKELRYKIFKLYGEICLKCGSTEDICIDHIKPYSLYPELKTDINNLQPLCRSCNSKKGNKFIIDYRITNFL